MCVFVVSNLVDCRRFRLPTCCGWRMVHLPLGDLSREKEERVKKKEGNHKCLSFYAGSENLKSNKQYVMRVSFISVEVSLFVR